jgi:enoyl-CoA hydratase/carnithine racemase
VTLNAGWHKAAEKLMLGDPITAQEALEMRLVNRVLPSAEVLPFAISQAERFSALPPTALRETRRLMKKAYQRFVDQAMADEIETFSQLLRGPEAKAAFAAFFARRSPAM